MLFFFYDNLKKRQMDLNINIAQNSIEMFFTQTVKKYAASVEFCISESATRSVRILSRICDNH